MIYKGHNPGKVISELQSAFKSKTCPHCNKNFNKMVDIKFNKKKKEVISQPNVTSTCCDKTGDIIAITISKIFAQNHIGDFRLNSNL